MMTSSDDGWRKDLIEKIILIKFLLDVSLAYSGTVSLKMRD